MSTEHPKRPSLMTGSDSGAADKASSARILADMESRSPKHASKHAAKHTPSGSPRRRAFPLILFGLLACTCALGGYLYFSGAPAVESFADPTTTPIAPTSAAETSAPAASIAAAVPPSTDTAVIVDDTAAGDAANPLANIGAAAGPASGTPAPGDAAATPAAAASGAAAPRTPVVVASTSSASKPRAARTNSTVARRTTPRTGEPDLLATLMANIGGYRSADPPATKNAKGSKTAAGQDSAMDELVANIRGNRDENYTSSATALGTIASASGSGSSTKATVPQQVARSASVQSELRQCPKANTLAGIDCRRRICSKYAGQDAACPR